jgi:hypothetical protein
MPIAKYDDAEDLEFYAQGVTMTWDEDKPVYYRGNALIRISKRDAKPTPKPPSRKRVQFMRERRRSKKKTNPPALIMKGQCKNLRETTAKEMKCRKVN